MQRNFNLILFSVLVGFSFFAIDARYNAHAQQRRLLNKQTKKDNTYQCKNQQNDDFDGDSDVDDQDAEQVFENTPEFDPTVGTDQDEEDDQGAIGQKAHELISFIVNTYLGKLQSSSISIDLKKRYFKECFERYFNVRQIAGFVLGRYGRMIKSADPRASEEDKRQEIELYKKKFVEYFTERVTDVYTRQFDNFRDVAVKVRSVETKEINKKKYYEVQTIIDMNNDNNFDAKDSSEDMKMVWTCVVDKNSRIVINDVNIGGISLRTTLQGVVQSEIESKEFVGNVNNYIDTKASQMSVGALSGN